MSQQVCIKRLTEFINENYTSLNSMLDLDVKKSNFEWIDWLENKGVKTTGTTYIKNVGREYSCKTPIANFLNLVYEELFKLTDTREEWEKDRWDVRNLEKYGVSYNKSLTHYFVNL